MGVTLQRVSIAVLGAFLCGGATSAQELHKDERLGFQLRVPRGWKGIPVRSDDAWIVGKFRATKPERSTDPTSGYTLEHYPELIVVALLDPEIRKELAAKPAPPPAPEGEGADAGDDEEGEDEEDEDEDDDEPTGPDYRDYAEYLKETCPYGHFIEKEEPGKHGGLAVTRFEILAEGKLNFAERRLITWVYETEIANLAVQIEVTSDAFKKHAGAIRDVLESFKVIPRTQELRAAVSDDHFMSSVELAKLSPGDRKAKKLASQAAEFERMKEGLTDGWTASVIDGVYVLNHVDERFAKKVVEHVLAIHAWLDQTFPEIGPHEHARFPIVRICKDAGEENAFRSGSGSFWVGGTHLVTHKGTRSETWEWEYIGSRTLQIWLLERDPELAAALPPWLAIGLSEVASSSRLKSGKLVFDMGDRERYVREDLPRGEDAAMSVRMLMNLSRAEFHAFGKRDDWSTWCQAVALTRYFVGARAKKTRALLSSYLANMAAVLAELEAEQEANGIVKKAPANEEEEEKLFEERKEWLEARERTLLDQVLARTFANWSAGDWRGLEREFRSSL